MRAIFKRKGLERGSKRVVGPGRDAENSPLLNDLTSHQMCKARTHRASPSELSAPTNWTILRKKSSALQAIKYAEVRTKPPL